MRKTEIITLRVTEQQKNDIKQAAAILNLSISSYLMLLYSKYNEDFYKNIK